jgi:hypothetical protein
VTGSNVQVLGKTQGRTVTVRELARKTELWRELGSDEETSSVWFPDWTMNADGFIS